MKKYNFKVGDLIYTPKRDNASYRLIIPGYYIIVAVDMINNHYHIDRSYITSSDYNYFYAGLKNDSESFGNQILNLSR